MANEPNYDGGSAAKDEIRVAAAAPHRRRTDANMTRIMICNKTAPNRLRRRRHGDGCHGRGYA